ncbi:unnamed protein product [Paramecium sonneborni]|uniref:non-specific serine/threonine protein kinase n=1 Tax=Paramecium sonneborni TaxID=65129 RepID=A0A8S1M8A0_9CILI|nr:unnamed protein product [Paramecium sonneborni]
MQQEQSSHLTINHFQLIKVIGKGSYAKVLLVRKNDTGKLYAIKALKKKYIQQKRQEEHIMVERNVLVSANHPFIIKLAFSFQNERKLYFVLEYCPGGELFNLLQKKKKLTEDQCRFYVCQMILAIEYLHENNIIYRDLKPENVILDADGYIRITDFGLSKKNVKQDKDAYSVCGTPEYLAPEILMKQGHGKPVDWWTLGCIIFEMITGMPPYYSNQRSELFEQIKFSFPKYPQSLSSVLKNLLEGLFQKQPEKRLGYNGAQEIKSHPWFEKVNWDYILQKKVEAPFRPKLTSEEDTSNFDSEFTECTIASFDTASSEGRIYYDFSYGGSMIKE